MAKNWYMDVLGSRLEKLYSLKPTCNPSEITKIEDTIEILESLIYGIEYAEEVHGDFLGRVELERDRLSIVKPYIELIKPLSKRDSVEEFPKNYGVRKYSEEELMDVVQDFLRSSLDDELYNRLRKIFKKKSKYVWMSRIGEMDGDGDTIYLPYFDEAFIRVKREDTITDLGSLAHEFGHGLQDFMNFDLQLHNEKRIFGEIVSTFFEFLLKDYLKSIREFKMATIDNERLYYNRRILRTKQIITMNEMFDKWENLKCSSVAALKKKMNSDLGGCDVKGIKSIDEVLSSKPSLYPPYVVAYIIAMEMFLVYTEDKKRGLDLLRKVMEIDLELPNDVYQNKLTELGLGGSERIDEYEKILSMNRSVNF
ncbi:MAG TPA: hypothetical protein DCY94_00830 [Firmicutes bacterium]|nr:hypothetical protein [Bacillota bacterium]